MKSAAHVYDDSRKFQINLKGQVNTSQMKITTAVMITQTQDKIAKINIIKNPITPTFMLPLKKAPKLALNSALRAR
jgi:hypothetical protein